MKTAQKTSKESCSNVPPKLSASAYTISAPAKKLKVNLTLPLEVDQTTTMYS